MIRAPTTIETTVETITQTTVRRIVSKDSLRTILQKFLPIPDDVKISVRISDPMRGQEEYDCYDIVMDYTIKEETSRKERV